MKKNSASEISVKPCRLSCIGWMTVACGIIVSGAAAWAQTSPKVGRGGTLEAGNSFYRVFVEDAVGSGVGQYTVTTGPAHPAGPGLNVLFGSGSPGTSFNTIRSYLTATDYIQDLGSKSSSYTNVTLDPFGVAQMLGTTGVRTTYDLSGPPITPDRLTIIQDVRVNGDSFETTTVEVTTTIRNTGFISARVGIRYLWDFQVGTDDGPTFQVNKPICSPVITEAQFNGPTFDAYRIEDNDVNPAPPTFSIFGTVAGPASVEPLPVPPDLVQYTCWPSAVGTAFEYTVDPARPIATADSNCQSGTGGGDTAVLYYWGNNAAKSINIPPGQEYTVSASLFLTPPQPPPPPGPCVTRSARFWLSHPDSTEAGNCVTLRKAIQASCEGGLNLGFISLPTLPRYNNVTEPSELAMIEALGLYWRSTKVTGEGGGTQNQKLRGAKLCQARKKLAAELIAAIGNTVLLGADPAVCNANFPADLVDQARIVAGGEDLAATLAMTKLLRLFNNSGVTNSLPDGWVECSAFDTKALRSIGRDPTTQLSCPGINDSCSNALAITSIPFKAGANTTRYTAQFQDSVCGTGGADVVWKLTPPVAAPNRHFTLDASDSNIATIFSVWKGTCDGLVPVNCGSTSPSFPSPGLTFRTDGTNTYYIVGEGGAGKIKMKLSSP
ncbi:MAG: hypothetical protein PCFJNLEI_03216 [Verrucomicrobiae bacterium]|nr:hypothetical protein [Verrucomicrobiae bacterium]